jgi:hypothetical protein
MTFLPGSLGQPFAGVFAPAATFTMHGGADMFGLSLLGEHDLCVPAEPLRSLVARISRTDIDLPDADAAEGEPAARSAGFTTARESGWVAQNRS